MNKSKYQTLTANNIYRVAEALKKMGTFRHYQTYPSSKVTANVVNTHNMPLLTKGYHFGLADYCLRSTDCVFDTSAGKIEIDNVVGRLFIRITYGVGRAGLIYAGAKFRLTGNRLYVRDTKDKCWPHRKCEAHPVQIFQPA